MSENPLDEMRKGYAKLIYDAAHHPDNDPDLRQALIESLLSEWGAKAYFQGREHMAERMKKLADDWKFATT